MEMARGSPRTGIAVDVMALVIALAPAATGCRRGEPPANAVKKLVRCAEVTSTTVSDVIELRGTVSPLPDKDALIASQVTGRITQVLVREGDVVHTGQPVARIDDGPLLDDAHAALAVVAKTRAELKNAQATQARVQHVFEHGIAARQEVEDATARAETASAAESEADAALRRSQRQVERAVVRSPLAGVVVHVFRRPGELVDGTAATPIVEIADPLRLELTTSATANDLVRAQAGQRAVIALSALPGASWSGAVSAVSPAVDRATGLGVVRIALELSHATRPPIGVLGMARIEVGHAVAAVVVPKAAVRAGADGGVEVVLCGGDGLAHVRAVSRGASTESALEARELTPGQAVAIDPVVGLVDGEPIEATK
jgi:multidrug efflux system membrane fusion protein